MRDDLYMRTTLDIDDDVLSAAKEYAADRGTTAGKILSEWARKALAAGESWDKSEVRNGVPLLAGRRDGPRVTPEMVKCLQNAQEQEELQRFRGPAVQDLGEA
jgi:hypothetical protein